MRAGNIDPNCDFHIVSSTFGCTGKVTPNRSWGLVNSTYSWANTNPATVRIRAADTAPARMLSLCEIPGRGQPTLDRNVRVVNQMGSDPAQNLKLTMRPTEPNLNELVPKSQSSPGPASACVCMKAGGAGTLFQMLVKLLPPTAMCWATSTSTFSCRSVTGINAFVDFSKFQSDRTAKHPNVASAAGQVAKGPVGDCATFMSSTSENRPVCFEDVYRTDSVTDASNRRRRQAARPAQPTSGPT